MRVRPFVELSFALAIVAVMLWQLRPDPPLPPVDCTCRELADAPAAFAGKRVRVSTAGTQRTPDGLVWRYFAHEPPAVELRGAVPDPAPPFLTGVCHAPLAGGPVRVSVGR